MIEEDSVMPPGSYTFDTLPPMTPGARRIIDELNFEKVAKYWPDRRRIACILAAEAEMMRRNQHWPPIGETSLYTLLAGFGARIGSAKAFEECKDIYSELLLHLEHPEPGWE